MNYHNKMEATLKFNLDDPDDVRSHLRCIKATDMALVLWNLETKVSMPDEVRNKFTELLEEYNINLDELII